MKQINRIKEVSELLHIPASALRYWDDEGLIRFERSDDNNYRYPTTQTMLDICDVMFYRSLSLSIKEIKAIPGMSVDSLERTLDSNVENLEEQIRLIQQTLKKLHTRRGMVERIKELEQSPFHLVHECLPDMKEFFTEDTQALQIYVNDPYQTAVLIHPSVSQEPQYGYFEEPCGETVTVHAGSPEPIHTGPLEPTHAGSLESPRALSPQPPAGAVSLLRKRDTAPRAYLRGLLKVEAETPSNHNAGEFLDAARSMGRRTGLLAGRYLLTACDRVRCDYYEAWLELTGGL